MDFLTLEIKRYLVVEILNDKSLFTPLENHFKFLLKKEDKTQEDYQFLRDYIEVLKVDPKKLR